MVLTDTLRIYHPTLEDLPRILAVQKTCYEADFLESDIAFRSKIAATAQTCWLATSRGEVMGYLITLPVSYATFPTLNAAVFEMPTAAELLYFHDLAITPAGRSLGLGRQLAERALQTAKARNIAKAGLIAVQSSIDYWARHGFEQIDPAVLDTQPGLLKKIASFGDDARYMETSLR